MSITPGNKVPYQHAAVHLVSSEDKRLQVSKGNEHLQQRPCDPRGHMSEVSVYPV